MGRGMLRPNLSRSANKDDRVRDASNRRGVPEPAAESQDLSVTALDSYSDVLLRGGNNASSPGSPQTDRRCQ